MQINRTICYQSKLLYSHNVITISLVNVLLIWAVLTAGLVSAGISLDLTGYMLSHIDMLLGMGLGITTAPLMMVAIKKWRMRRKVNKILNDIIQMRKEQTAIQEKEILE